MFCYQKNTKDLSAVKCRREDFWKCIRQSSTPWLIDSRREIRAAVEANDKEAMARWAAHEDFRKFDLRTLRNLKTATAKDRWKKKGTDKKLLAWADDLKKTLPVFTFSCREFDLVSYKPKRKRKDEPEPKARMVTRRQLAGCHLNGLVMLDIDHVENPTEVWEKLQQQEELMKRVVLVHLTSSGNGIRIIFTADGTLGNLADNQIVLAGQLGYTADDSCIDATRNSFAPKEEDILFIDEERLFTYYDEAFDNQYTPAYREKKTQPLHHQFTGNEGVTDGRSAPQPLNLAGKGDDRSKDESWHGFDLQAIIDAKYGDDLPREGGKSRHNSSLELASDLLLMTDGNKELTLLMLEKQPWVKEIIDERNEDVEKTVESAGEFNRKKEKSTLHPYPSTNMQQAIRQVTGKPFREWEYGESPVSRQTQLEHRLLEWGHQIGELFDDFPMLKDVCGDLPVMQRPAAVFLAGGFMMTLMTRCWYRFYHKPQLKRRLNCSLLIIGDPASGKSVATDLYDLLCAPIKAADKAGKNAVNSWKETTEAASQNKDKQVKPHAKIRIHPARTSNQTFITDMVNTKEVIDGEEMQLHMLTFDSELDNTLTLQGGGSWINKLALELKAFHNEEDGQAYSNKGSIQDDFNVTWNYIYTGTPLAMKSKVNNKNFGTGLPTRLTCIPMPATNFKMMKMDDYEHYDFERDDRMRKWASLLDRTKGELKLWPLVKNLWEWTNRRMQDASEDESKAEEMLCKRCAYHGLNYSAPYIVMRHWNQMHEDGNYWCGDISVDEKDWKLCELLTNIHHACQIHYFLGMAENYFDNQQAEEASAKTHRLKTVEGFNKLSREFTTEDVMRCFNVKYEAARAKIKRLLNDHIIEKSGEYVENGTTKAKYTKIGVIL